MRNLPHAHNCANIAQQLIFTQRIQMAKIEKGKAGILRYTKQARHRIGVSIRWDAVEEQVKRPELFKLARPTESDDAESVKGFVNPYGQDIKAEIGMVRETFDVDLICLMFNSDKELVDAVSPMDGEEIDHSGKIYHSGDERHGASINDDEIISVELKDLPDYIHHIVFFATVQSGHDYSMIVNPEARIYDAMNDRDLMLVSMGGPASAGQTAFIFCRIFRGPEDWMVHNISEFRVDRQVRDWAEEVKPFLELA